MQDLTLTTEGKGKFISKIRPLPQNEKLFELIYADGAKQIGDEVNLQNYNYYMSIMEK